ncbi:MAG: uroporphyrinogen decarboxylase/cobalamine-independent methonine synthase family protein [Chloroflexota bacterium]
MPYTVEEMLQRHSAFWRRERVDRPLVTLRPYTPLAHKRLPLADGTVSAGDIQLKPEMIEPARMDALEQRRAQAGRLLLGGSFSARGPYERIPWVEAILGCPVWADNNSGSIWPESRLTGVRAPHQFDLSLANPWFAKLLEATRRLVAANDGSYLVAHTLMRGPIDMVGALVGDVEMCLAVMDDVEGTRALLEEVTPAFIAIAKAQTAAIPPFHGGHCTQFGVWAPGTVVRTQCDMSSVTSARLYADLFLPYDERICSAFDYSVIHLHSGFLHTVDEILKRERPAAIQISLDTGSTPVTARDVLPIAQKIMTRKPLLMEGQIAVDDLAYLLENLPAAGLHIAANIVEAEMVAAKKLVGQEE